MGIYIVLVIIFILSVIILLSNSNKGEKKKQDKKTSTKFDIKIVTYYKNYICFEYTSNYGITWDRIHHASSPFLGLLSYDWEWKVLIYKFNPHTSSFKYELEKFSTLEKIKEYERLELEKFNQKSAEHKKEREENNNFFNDKLKEINKK